MSIRSTSHLRHSLPNRSPSHRARSLSLSEYQPLTFDRDSVQAAYQQSLLVPTSSSTSAYTHRSVSSFSLPGSAATTDTSNSAGSRYPYKPGNRTYASQVHLPLHTEDVLDPPTSNFAGVGADHSLTPPGSPVHRTAQKVHRHVILSPVPSSPRPPTPPPKPMRISDASEMPTNSRIPADHPFHRGVRREHSAMDIDTDRVAAGYKSAPGFNPSPRNRSKRRALPPVPTNVPRPAPPTWEPDCKSHIPFGLTAPSVQDAYAQLSAPPPNLTPRRTQPFRQAAAVRSPSRPRPFRDSTGSMDVRGSQTTVPMQDMAMDDPTAGPSRPSRVNLPAGAPEYPPMTDEPASMVVTEQPKPRGDAESEVTLKAEGKTPIWSTHYLDPCLRNSLVAIPQQVTNVTNVALTGLSSGPKTRFNTTTGAPIDGMARMAKDWFVKPDGKFTSESGAIELGLGVVNGVREGWGSDKGRKRARVEVISKSGGIKVDVIEVDSNRQLDLRIETKSGDVLVLLPETFHGPLHISSPNHEPVFLGILQPQCQPIAHPYETFYTTFVTPLASTDPKKSSSFEHKTASMIQKFVPKSFLEQSDMLDQVVSGFATHTRGEQSKITVQSSKGRVVFGYRETRDEETVKGMGLKVGVQEQQQRKKKWWWQS